MSHRTEDYITTITTFEFKVFDRSLKDYLYDATPEQCCNYVWKNYYSSADFTKMTEFGIKEVYIKHIDKVVLKSIVNVHANGHDHEMNEETKRQALDKASSFKKKHNIE